jgi:predicted CXXCH cytochrome family protein
MVESGCYERGDLSCISCHSMHRSKPDDQLALGMDGNEACFKCHDSYRGRLEQHTRHKPGSSGSQCYNCHMPHDTYGLLKAVRSHHIASPSVETSLEVGRPNACNLCHLDKTIAWTARYLTEWYGKEPLHLGEEESKTSAVLLWLLRGDAAQRALISWSLGWKPARETSGELWLAPFLAELLNDSYSAVRYIAYRSLRQLPGFEQLKYDYVGPGPDLIAARDKVLEIWLRTHKAKLDRIGPEILIDADGNPDRARIDRLLQQRDNRPVELIE